MRKYFGLALAWGVLLASTARISATVVEALDPQEIPKVLTAASRAAPDTKWDRACRVNGVVTVWGKDCRNHEVKVILDDPISVETTLSLKEVPEVVTAALQKGQPEFKAAGVKLVRWHSTTTTAYVFRGKGARGEDREVWVSPDGKKVSSRPIRPHR